MQKLHIGPHDHGHQHGHDHGHNHQVSNYNVAFAVGILLNAVFVAIETGYGMAAGSLALIADAGHNLSDVLGLLLAWGAGKLAAKPATEKRTYGFRKVTIMASLVSAVFLLVALGGIAWEAVNRFSVPKPVDSMMVITVAAIGVVINTVTALLFMSGQKHDLNIRGAFLHMLADAAVSLGVVVAGIIIMLKGWLLVDPIISLGIVTVILIGTWSLLRDSLNLALDSVPAHIDMAEIKTYLMGLEGVCQLHDLHVWAMSTTEVALSVHLILLDAAVSKDFLPKIQQQLHDGFGIGHSTIQIERQGDDGDGLCLLNKHNCI
jgi:cobalt-zinc-cadmium efflux system protein